MSPTESHAWFRSATARDRSRVVIQCAAVEHIWACRLESLREERDDIRSVTLGGKYRPDGLVDAAVRAAIELAVVVAIFPDEPRHVLRPSWE